MREHQSDEDQDADEFLRQEYKHFLSNKAEGTIDAYVRTTRRVMEWIAQRPGNGGIFHPRQLTKTAVEVRVLRHFPSAHLDHYPCSHLALCKHCLGAPKPT